MISRTPPPHLLRTPHPTPRPYQRGFTLIEVLITVVVLGVLLAVAFPSYLDSVRKSRRAEGIAALMAVQQAQERFRANQPRYGAFAAQGTLPALPNSAALATSANGRYAITVPANNETGYTLLATAGGAQASDTACALMGVLANGGNLRYGSGATSINWAAANADAGRCWAQ